jgi:hypothetical protein
MKPAQPDPKVVAAQGKELATKFQTDRGNLIRANETIAAKDATIAALQSDKAALQTLVRTLVEALGHYSGHKWNCPLFNPSEREMAENPKCDCNAHIAMTALTAFEAAKKQGIV